LAHGKIYMAYEKLWKLIGPKPFTSDGGADGRVTIADTVHFKVKQLVILKSSSIPQETYQVNRVENSTTLYLGPVNSRIEVRSDISLFTTADSATIEAVVQPRSKVPEQEVERLTYDEEPTVARRVVLVDPYGDYYTLDSPLPVDATLNVESLDISLDAKTGDNISISAHLNPLFAEASSSLTLSTYQQVFSYTSTNANTRISAIISSISTTANAVVKINGTIIRKFRTSPSERQASFIFYEHRPLPLGAVLTVEVQPDRTINSPFDVFTSLEGYLA
jgi:hypothetical protein